MARAPRHWNCPATLSDDPYRRAVYVRDGTRWVRIGTLCRGCGDFVPEDVVGRARKRSVA